LKAPEIDFSPGALPRKLALACMEEDVAEGARTNKLAFDRVDPSGTKIDFDSESRRSPRLPTDNAPSRQRVTLDLDKALLPSKGSALHSVGQCVACAWFWKPQGCQNDTECSYCHLCPQGEIRRRRKMKNAEIRHKSSNTNDAARPRQSLEILPLLH
jgi:hypothetical protein